MLPPEFLMTALIVVIVPGTGFIYTVSKGMSQGWRAGVIAALACTLGIVPHLLAAILGLSAIVHVSSVVFQILKFAGVGYLLYLAWGMWRHANLFEPSSNEKPTKRGQMVVRGVLLNLLNPKLSLFFFAFLPQFVSPESATFTGDVILLSVTFMAMTAVVFSIYGVLASSIQGLLARSPRIARWIQRSFAGLLAVFAIRLAVTANE